MLKRLIFWEYARGSWQYDIIVGLILAFLFLTPRDWFRDQPRILRSGDITMLSADRGEYLVSPGALVQVAEDQRVQTLTRVLQARSGDRRIQVTRIEPVLDSEGELQGYMVYTRP